MREGKALMQVTGQGTKDKALEEERREVVERPANTKMGHTVEDDWDFKHGTKRTSYVFYAYTLGAVFLSGMGRLAW